MSGLYKKKKKTKQFVFHQIKIQDQGVLPNDVFARDVRICFRHGRFTLMESQAVAIENKTRRGVQSTEKERMCAIDPGVRKFLTGYSPQGSGFIIGCNNSTVLDKCIRRIDRSKEKYKNTKVLSKTMETKKAKRLLYRTRKMYRAHFLCQSFDTILYPDFNAKAIAQGPLNKIVKRRLNMLSFYQFSQKLQQTATFYPNVTIKRGSEAYTSKQCGGCGVLNDKLGGSEVFECNECGLKADRDMHAARNILLRNLS